MHGKLRKQFFKVQNTFFRKKNKKKFFKFQKYLKETKNLQVNKLISECRLISESSYNEKCKSVFTNIPYGIHIPCAHNVQP